MLCEKSRASYMPVHYTDHEDPNTGQLMEGQWRESVLNSSLISQKSVGCRGTRKAEAIRNRFMDFFNGPGALPWQENILD